ncbi:MAG: MBL fold metallo-hydrolase [Opitutaceae bacterium]|nr:MBL fold metallo-hydrolase [Opitutaceae bacterium]MBP9913329.1 MBL fold metallo-hydrolase [Opitutaceae bacterium]
MSTLATQIALARPAAGSVAAWWLGGSGFIFKTPAGRQIWIDPYLSDIVQTMFGLGRAFPPPLTPAEAEPDIVISTHWHEDHLDPEAIPAIARHRPTAKFIMSPGAMSHAIPLGVPKEQITPLVPGGTLDLDGVKLTAIVARHEAGVPGWEVPDAFGVILDFGGVRVFHTGDTDYDARIHRAVGATPLALATLCINGSVGNMNAHEAALLAWHLNARTVIPHHHLIWERPPEKIPAYETLDPQLFADTYRKLGGTAQVLIPTVGEGFTLSPTGSKSL